jgi:hypothetical protein
MRVARFGLAAAVLLTAACRKGPETSSAAGRPGGPPRGDALWFADPAGAVEAGIEERLKRLSAAAVFLPAGALALQGGRPAFVPVAPPERPVSASPVVLVVRCDPAVSAALAAEAGLDPDAGASALAGGLLPLAAAGSPFGRVAGVHLDFPFSAASAKKSGQLLAALKAKAPGVWVSIAAPFSPASEDAREALWSLTNQADALVVPVFGLDAHGDAASVDLLGRPWWAAFGAATQGAIVPADGSGRTAGAAEKWLDPLTGNPRVDFENDLSVPDASFAAFHLIARGPVRLEGLSLENGDRVTYRVPALTELLFQLGSTMAGKKNALGRLLVFDGAEEAGRVLPVAALEDVILGRSLLPALVASVSPAGRGAIAVEAANRSPHASIASRTSNWVEVDLAPAHPGDVALGGFDRYAAYDAAGQSVTLGRATRIRLFETLVAPNETISPARIVLRGKPPVPCCRWRTQLIAASGSEEKSEWTEPPIPPTPTPAPRKKKR